MSSIKNEFRYIKNQNQTKDLFVLLFLLVSFFIFGFSVSFLIKPEEPLDYLELKKELAACEETSAIEAEKYGVCRNLLTLIKVYEE